MLEHFPIKMNIQGKEYDLQYLQELQVAEETINENLKDQPALFAFYAVLEEVAEAEYVEAKLRVEIVEAQLDYEYRKTSEKVTENLIRNKIRCDDKYLSAVVAMNDAKKNTGILKAIKDSFSHRKEIVIALASNMRAQMDSEIFVKKQEFRNTIK